MNSSPLGSLPPFPSTGVKLLLLQRLRDHIVSINECDWTTDDVCHKLMKPWINSADCSFVEFLKTNHAVSIHPVLNLTYDDVCNDKADIFISHAWRYKFVDVVSSIESYFENIPVDSGKSADSVYLWFDLVVNDQFNAVFLPQDWWKTVFMQAIQSIGSTMMICIPWNNPVTLTRAWCLWELYCTKMAKANLTLQLNRKEIKSFQEKLRSEPSCIIESMCDIDVEKSQAWKADDLAMIFDAVRSIDRGFHGFNVDVKSLLRQWILNASKEMVALGNSSGSTETNISNLRQINSDGSELSNKEKTLHRLADVISVARILRSQGLYDEAKVQLQEAVAEYKILLGSYHPRTSMAQNNLAGILFELKQHSEAKSVFEDALKGLVITLGRNHADTLKVVINLGNVLLMESRRPEALKMFDWAYQCRLSSLGASNVDTLRVLNSTAIALIKAQKYGEAGEKFREVLTGYEATLGLNHPDTLLAAHNLGNAIRDGQGDYDEARALYERAVKGSEAIFGPNSKEALQAQFSHAVLIEKTGDFVLAQQMFETVVQGRIATVGGQNLDTAFATRHLANILVRQEKYSEAQAQYVKAMDIFRVAKSADHAYTLDVLEAFGDVCVKANDLETAKSVYQHLVNHKNRKNHTQTQPLMLKLMETLVALNQIDSAKAVYEKYMEIEKNKPKYRFASDNEAEESVFSIEETNQHSKMSSIDIDSGVYDRYEFVDEFRLFELEIGQLLSEPIENTDADSVQKLSREVWKCIEKAKDNNKVDQGINLIKGLLSLLKRYNLNVLDLELCMQAMIDYMAVDKLISGTDDSRVASSTTGKSAGPAYPDMITHNSHDHELILSMCDYPHHDFGCDLCGKPGYGWVYQCKTCPKGRFDLHPSCSKKTALLKNLKNAFFSLVK